MRRWTTLIAVGAATLLAASLTPTGTAEAEGPCGTATTTPPARYDHIVLVVFENKNQDQIFGGTAAPYLTSLSRLCGRGTNMHTPDPLTSLGNYIALTSGYVGYPDHITSNSSPRTWPQSSVSIFEQLDGDWKELSENAPSNCYARAAFDFTVNHTPAPYYTRLADSCKINDIPMPANPDLSAAFTLLTPNKSHIMHEDDAPGTTTQTQRIRAGDNWAASYLPKVFNSPQYQAGRTAVIITFDEASKRRTDIPFIVVSPYTPAGYQTNVRMTHFSTLKGMQEMLGLPLLGHARDVGNPSIRDYFGLR